MRRPVIDFIYAQEDTAECNWMTYRNAVIAGGPYNVDKEGGLWMRYQHAKHKREAFTANTP